MSERDQELTETKPGDVLAGKYRVDRVLGAGGMGVVVQATHLVLNDRVALKFLLPHVLGNKGIAERFLREAQAAVRIKSPHVARATDVGTLESGSPYIVMEYLEGSDLATVLEADGPLDVTVACHMALQTCEALASAHAVGVIHRDIKPANLFITRAPDGSPLVKVLDFGISKLTAEFGMAEASLTQTQVSMGSPLYMSPEQMRSARSVDSRTDIWSLGVVLYEMLTGALPFMADSMPQLCALVLETTAPPANTLRPDLPEGLDAVLSRCLARKPEDRYGDVGELAADLAQYAGPEAMHTAARVARIVEQAGLGRTMDLGKVRESMHSLAMAASNAAMPAQKTPTATSFGKTEAPLPAEPQGRGRLVALGAAVVLVGAVGAVFLFRSPEAPASDAPASAPLVTSTAEPPALPAEPAVTPQPSGSSDPPDAAATAEPKPEPQPVAKPAAKPVAKPAAKPNPKSEKPKPKPTAQPTTNVFEDRK